MFSHKKALTIFSILFLVFPGVMAQSISFAEPDTITHKDVYLYYANGTLIGLYNTTSTGISIPNATYGDLLFVIKPQYSTPLDDPSAWLTSFLAYINTNAIVLLAAAIIIGIMFTRR
jgi:hypothetical protein